jgi:hypothetical protein
VDEQLVNTELPLGAGDVLFSVRLVTTTLTGQCGRVRSSWRRRLTCGSLVVVLTACGGGDRPDYDDARAVASAVNGGGISCRYGPMAAEEAYGAESTGLCEGNDFVLRIYVYATEQEREERLQAARALACSEGLSIGSYVAAGRWFVTLDAPPTTDPDAVYMSDIARATEGERIPQDC